MGWKVFRVKWEVCDMSAFPLIAFRQLNVFQHAQDVLQGDTQEQQSLKYSDSGNSRSFLKVSLQGDIVRLNQDIVERTPRWDGKEEQKKIVKPVVRLEEAKENMTVKPPSGLEAIKRTTVITAVRPGPGVEEAKEKTIVTPLPRVEGAKEKATVKPSSGVKESHENSVFKLQTKLKESSVSVTTVRPFSRAAAVIEKKILRAADFNSEPQWDFEDKYLLDNSSPPLVGALPRMMPRCCTCLLSPGQVCPWQWRMISRLVGQLTGKCRCCWDLYVRFG